MTATFDSPAESLGEHIARLAAIEAEAEAVQTWQPLVVPGALQAFAYACAAIHGASLAVPLAEGAWQGFVDWVKRNA
ncbi:Scr1 family TA system antitoxin-like transcriptional regulator [Streptomyces sp. NPDC021080]|uniref:Scr1 family TA system antitoxin-like transcriptional regulator n=1 Tax=Streptomyces sp. NPDC021080 TaxID=3365110 RepID=UPI0037A4B0D2